MAALCVASQLGLSSQALCSSTSSHKAAAQDGGGAARQVKVGKMMVRASLSETNYSRRDAVFVAGSALAGLLLLLPAASAGATTNGARTINPGVRKELKEAIEKLKAEGGKSAEEAKKTLAGAAKQVGDKFAKK